MSCDFENIVSSGDFVEVERCSIADDVVYVVCAYDIADRQRTNAAILFSSANRDEADEIGCWWDNQLEILNRGGRYARI